MTLTMNFIMFRVAFIFSYHQINRQNIFFENMQNYLKVKNIFKLNYETLFVHNK